MIQLDFRSRTKKNDSATLVWVWRHKTSPRCFSHAETIASSYFKNRTSSFQKLQYDLWGVTPTDLWDWESLKADISRWVPFKAEYEVLISDQLQHLHSCRWFLWYMGI